MANDTADELVGIIADTLKYEGAITTLLMMASYHKIKWEKEGKTEVSCDEIVTYMLRLAMSFLTSAEAGQRFPIDDHNLFAEAFGDEIAAEMKAKGL